MQLRQGGEGRDQVWVCVRQGGGGMPPPRRSLLEPACWRWALGSLCRLHKAHEHACKAPHVERPLHAARSPLTFFCRAQRSA